VFTSEAVKISPETKVLKGNLFSLET